MYSKLRIHGHQVKTHGLQYLSINKEATGQGGGELVPGRTCVMLMESHLRYGMMIEGQKKRQVKLSVSEVLGKRGLKYFRISFQDCEEHTWV